MINWSQKDGVIELELSSEPCNEIGSRMVEALERFLDDIDPSRAKALIIHSTLDSGFCAGADLNELYHGMNTRPKEEHVPEIRKFLDRVHGVMDRLDMLPLTTIGVINGLCFGGGFELALTCDLLIAEVRARFAFPELRLGIIPGFGGIPRLKRDVGNGVVRDLLLTGRSINAKKAAAIGLVSQLVATGEGLAAARLTAAQSVKFDRDAMVCVKEFIKPLPAAELAQEKEHFLRLLQNPRLMQALKSFVESTDIRPYLV
jgi:enoyl-CoA hydratase/carnithine racemase